MSVTTTETTGQAVETVADLLERLGDIPPERVWVRPAPGTATEVDVLAAGDHLDRLCELVDGTLVEKAMGLRESLLAVAIASLLRAFIDPRNLGIVTGSDGTMRLFPGLVRMPDVAFSSWDRFPDRKVPKVPIPDLAPDLAVEVLSESNTPKEMARKRQEYFAAGTRLVWEVDPKARQVSVFTAPEARTVFREGQALDGGDVLPGFALPLADLFAELDRHAG
jgi:Uma2 family endonuclease